VTAEAEFLLATVRRRGATVPPALDWQKLLQLADTHGLFMQFCHDFPAELPDEFADHARSQWTSSAFLAGELKSLLQEFSRHGIEVLPLKGPLLATLLYGSPSHRICDDLDLLVRPADMPRAEELMGTLGFQPVYPADDYHQSLARRGTFVELHFAVAPPSNPTIDLPAAWARARTVTFQGQPARFFAPPDLLMYLVLHLVKHDFSRLIWLLDTHLALKQLSSDEVNELLIMARRMGIEGAFLTTCALIEAVFEQPLPGPLARAVARKPVISTQARQILTQMLEAPVDATTTHQGTQTFIQLEPGMRARWAQRLRALRPSHQDYAWAASHHLNPQWMLILRPLRLVRKHGPGSAWRALFPRSSTARQAEDRQER
jgi:hypothetical protein